MTARGERGGVRFMVGWLIDNTLWGVLVGCLLSPVLALILWWLS